MIQTAAAPPAPTIVLLAGALFVAALVMFAPAIFNDGDTYWHLAAGRWMLDHGEVLRADVFSYTHEGKPWDAHEWLAEGAMALAYRLAGWSGLAVMFAGAAATTAWIVIRRLERDLSGVTLLTVLVLAAYCIAPSLLARPHLLALPLLAAWTVELLSAREADRAPRPVFLAMLVVWANLHGSYVFAFVLLAAFGAEALIEAQAQDRWRVLRDWGLFSGLGVLAAMVTPQGFDGLIYPFKIMGMKNLNAIQEWQPQDFSKPHQFEIALLATLFVCLGRGVRAPVLRVTLLLFLLFMALQHSRHEMILAIVAPLVLAKPLATALGRKGDAAIGAGRVWPIALAAGCVLAGVRLAAPIARVNGQTSPIAAIAHVPAALASQPVLNDYGFGGYLIFKGVRPFIDGRADMYGDKYFGDFIRATEPDPPALRRMLADYKVAWTIFTPADPTVKAMDGEPGWRRLYADKFAVVHVRQDALPIVEAAIAPPVLRR